MRNRQRQRQTEREKDPEKHRQTERVMRKCDIRRLCATSFEAIDNDCDQSS